MALVITATGDISFNGCYHEVADRASQSEILGAVKAALAGDLVIGNLESPLTSRPEIPPPWRYRLRGHQSHLSTLKDAGFSVMTLGNNHAMDFGSAGLIDTIDLLDSNRIAHVGAGKNLAEARRALIVTVKGQRVSILSYCSVPVNGPLYATESEPGVAPAEPKFIAEDVARARQNSEWVVVYMHWGDEHLALPSPEQRTLGADIIRMGANLVLGCHSHVLQPAERVDKGLVAYSLGNFVFSSEKWHGVNTLGEPFTMDMGMRPEHQLAGILKVELGSDGVQAFSLQPTRIDDRGQIRLDDATRAASWERASRDLSSPMYGAKWKVESARVRLQTLMYEKFPGGIPALIQRGWNRASGGGAQRRPS